MSGRGFRHISNIKVLGSNMYRDIEEMSWSVCDNNIVSSARVFFQSMLLSASTFSTFSPQSLSLTYCKAALTAFNQGRINWILPRKGDG